VAADTIHLVIRAVDGGFYATSPQAPGLAYLRPTLDELRADVDGVLAFHLDRPGPFTVLEHHELHWPATTPGRPAGALGRSCRRGPCPRRRSGRSNEHHFSTDFGKERRDSPADSARRP